MADSSVLTDSLKLPMPKLQKAQRIPRTLPVSWSWSMANFPLPFLPSFFGIPIPQIAHNPFCAVYIFSYSARSIPYWRRRFVSSRRLIPALYRVFSAFLPMARRFVLRHSKQRSGRRWPSAGIGFPQLRQYFSGGGY